MGDKALRVVDGAIYVAKSAPLGTAVKVTPSPFTLCSIKSADRPQRQCELQRKVVVWS